MERYAFDEETVKPYFEVTRVLEDGPLDRRRQAILAVRPGRDLAGWIR